MWIGFIGFRFLITGYFSIMDTCRRVFYITACPAQFYLVVLNFYIIHGNPFQERGNKKLVQV